MRNMDVNMMKRYNDAVNMFMGMNPKNPFWLLFVLYLRKYNKLEIVDRVDCDSHNVLASLMYLYEDESLRPVEKEDKFLIGYFNDKDYALYQQLEDWAEKLQYPGAGIFRQKRWESRYLIEVAETILGLSDEWFDSNYRDLFDSLLQRILSRYSTFFIEQPKELTQLACKFLRYEGGKVLNPCAGTGSYAVELNIGENYEGQEASKLETLMAELKFMAFGLKGSTMWNCSDIVAPPYPVDYIISTYPFGPNNNLKQILSLVAHARRSVLVGGLSLLYDRNPQIKSMKKLLLERDLIESVILLPQKLFAKYTGSDSCIIVTNEEKSHQGFVKFIDASNCYFQDGVKTILDERTVLELFSESEVHGKVKTIPTLQVLDNDCDLSVESYLAGDIIVPEGFTMCKITELGSFISAPKNSSINKCVRVKDLSPHLDLTPKTANDYLSVELPSRATFVDVDAILISNVRILKPTLFSAAQGGVNISNCSAIQVDVTKVLPAYLAIELSKDYVIKQIRRGAFIPNISMRELKKINVLVPSLDKQRQIVEQLIADKKSSDDFSNIERFLNYEKNMRMRKHALSQILGPIVSASERLTKYVINCEMSFNKTDVVSQRKGDTFEDYLIKLNKNIRKINDLIDKLTVEQTYGSPDYFDFADFFNDYRGKKFQDNYDIITDYIYVLDDTNPYPGAFPISISKHDLTTVFDNIFTNAQKYGFNDSSRNDYCIKVIATTVHINGENFLKVNILNNGKALPVGMQAEQMFHWGVGENTGIGTWQAKNIIEYFGGKVSFAQNIEAQDGFIIDFEILLPIRDKNE